MKSMNAIYILAFAISSLVVTPAEAQPQRFYAYPVQRQAPQGGGSCTAQAINESGRIVGTCLTRDRTFGVLSGERGKNLKEIGSVPGIEGWVQPLALNARGQVVGCITDPLTKYRQAFVTDADGKNMRIIKMPPEFSGFVATATGIDDEGRVVGYFYGPLRSYGFVTLPGGDGAVTLQDSGEDITPRSINNRGQIVGSVEGGNLLTHPFLTSLGQTTIKDLAPHSRNRIYANAISDNGIVVGTMYGYKGDGTAAVMRVGREEFIFEGLGGQSAAAYAINNNGIFVGSAAPDHINSWQAYIGFKGGRSANLNHLIVNLPDSSHLDSAYGINSSNQIAANGSGGRIYIVCPTPRCR